MTKRWLLCTAVCLAASCGWSPAFGATGSAKTGTDKYGQVAVTKSSPATTLKPSTTVVGAKSKSATSATSAKSPSTSTSPSGSAANNNSTVPAKRSNAYVVVDDTNAIQLAASGDAHKAKRPASLSKLVTALVVLEKLPLTEHVVISAHAASMPDSRVGLIAGKSYRAADLFDAMLVASANDAAVALAEAASGSLDNFAKDAAALATRMHLNDSPVINDPTGLDDEDSHQGGNWMSASDLALLTRTAIKQPEIMAAAKRSSVNFKSLDDQHAITKRSTNGLLKLVGVEGLKTGYTSAAGYCQILVTTREARTLITVAMGEPNSNQLDARLALMTEAGFKMATDSSFPAVGAPIVIARATGNRSSSLSSSGSASALSSKSVAESISESTSKTAIASTTTPTTAASTTTSRAPLSITMPSTLQTRPPATVTATAPTTVATTTQSTASTTPITIFVPTVVGTTLGSTALSTGRGSLASGVSHITRQPGQDTPVGVLALVGAGVAGIGAAAGGVIWRRLGTNRRFDNRHFR